jgi:enediyne biosynthesis protein E4
MCIGVIAYMEVRFYRPSWNFLMRSSELVLRHVSLPIVLASFCLPSDTFALPTFSEHGATILGSVDFDSRSASLADIDNDGDLDLLFLGSTGAQQLFRNNLIGGGALTYTNVSGMLPAGLGSSWSAAWGDYDGDGRIDVFVGRGGSSAVLRNNGAFGFVNASFSTGLNDPGFNQNVAWADIDHDRDLDLLISMEGPEPHEIYLHGPANQFAPVGAAVGFQQDFGTKGYGMAIGDTDGDGDLDVYISTCIGTKILRNNFYENQLAETGSLSFIDIADANGTQNLRNSYGAEFHDFDDDGDLDLFLVGADLERSKIFRNDGGNQFTDVDTITGHSLLSNEGGDLNGARAVDYDNDGDLDLFFHDHLAVPALGKDYARLLYRNDGNWNFTDVTAAEGLNSTHEGAYDSTWGDIDLDGDQDLIAPTGSTISERIFLSDVSTNGNHWLYVRLNGPTDNTTGIGASLYATTDEGTPDERTLRREANTNAGTFNQSDLPVHFGLGAAELIDELRVVWPDGTVQYLQDVAVDQYLTIDFPTPLPGDYNTDGIVDAADYTVWRNRLGSGVSLPNDTTPGVGLDDYTRWKVHFGETTAGSAASEINPAIPEPSTAILFLLGLIATGVTTRGVRRRASLLTIDVAI